MNPPISGPPTSQEGAARILILTAGFGEGHNAAARALASAADAALGPGASRVLDVFAAAAPRLNGITRGAYLQMINRTPRLWSVLYRWSDRSPTVATRLVRLLGREQRLLARVVDEMRPEAICSTYPVYGFLLEKVARAGVGIPPHYNIVTDSISIHSLWRRSPCEAWFVPNDDSAAVMREAGVEPGRVHALGFPLAPFFHDNMGRLAPPDLSAGATPRVLHIVHSGTYRAEETARLLLTRDDWEITFAVGRDERLRRRLERLARGRSRPATILGWTSEIPRLLMTHNAVVSKAGGATTQEALAAGCPMIVNQVLPGQEEGNWALLHSHGIGARAESPAEIVDELRRAFASRGRVWHKWRAATVSLAKLTAASDIVNHVIERTLASPRRIAVS